MDGLELVMQVAEVTQELGADHRPNRMKIKLAADQRPYDRGLGRYDYFHTQRYLKITICDPERFDTFICNRFYRVTIERIPDEEVAARQAEQDAADAQTLAQYEHQKSERMATGIYTGVGIYASYSPAVSQ